MIVVVDASVALKWFFQARSNEDHTGKALDILAAVVAQHLTMIQPAHFIAEVAAVLAREKTDEAYADLADLEVIDWQIRNDPQDYARAVELASGSPAHVFDTLYHAVALGIPQAVLVTADRRYYRRARQYGQIQLLGDFEV